MVAALTTSVVCVLRYSVCGAKRFVKKENYFLTMAFLRNFPISLKFSVPPGITLHKCVCLFISDSGIRGIRGDNAGRFHCCRVADVSGYCF